MGFLTVSAIVAPVLIFSFGGGVSSPSSQIGAMRAIPRLAGAASGLNLFASLVVAGCFTQLTSEIVGENQFRITVSLIVLAVFSLIAALFVTKANQE
jgi:hypothetical protein